jgi:hypothetical protein
MKMSELKMPTKNSRSSAGTPRSLRYCGRKAKIWATP